MQAWSLLTGFKYQYVIQKDEKGRWIATAKFDPKTNEFADQANSPYGGMNLVWTVPWPDVGGGGTKALTQNQLFCRMCAWDDENFLIAASSRGSSDKNKTNGIVDNHCYTVIECRDDVAGTGIDLIQVRNPWGRQEIEKGMFADNGPGWEKYPQVFRELNPVFADDGIFWVTKDEFFRYYETIWLSATNMTRFLKS